MLVLTACLLLPSGQTIWLNIGLKPSFEAEPSHICVFWMMDLKLETALFIFGVTLVLYLTSVNVLIQQFQIHHSSVTVVIFIIAEFLDV